MYKLLQNPAFSTGVSTVSGLVGIAAAVLPFVFNSIQYISDTTMWVISGFFFLIAIIAAVYNVVQRLWAQLDEQKEQVQALSTQLATLHRRLNPQWKISYGADVPPVTEAPDNVYWKIEQARKNVKKDIDQRLNAHTTSFELYTTKVSNTFAAHQKQISDIEKKAED